MKLNLTSKRTSISRLAPGLIGLMMAGAGAIGQAQSSDFIVDQFDTDSTGALANQGWGTAVPVIIWDNTVNETTTLGPDNNGSGSALWTIDWSSSNGSDQVMVDEGLGATVDLRGYTNVSYDIRFDPSSATDGNGSYGGLEVDWVPQSDGWPSTSQAITTFYTTNHDWVHVSYPLNASGNTKLQAVTGIGFKMQQKRTGTSLSGVTKFWMDNIILGARTNAVPPPTLSVAKVATPPGLMVVACGGGNEYNRSLVRTLNGSYSWVGDGSSPATYSMTIAGYPDTNHTGFQSVLFLVPGTQNDPGIDWDAANVVEMVIQNNADGSATGSFQVQDQRRPGERPVWRCWPPGRHPLRHAVGAVERYVPQRHQCDLDRTRRSVHQRELPRRQYAPNLVPESGERLFWKSTGWGQQCRPGLGLLQLLHHQCP